MSLNFLPWVVSFILVVEAYSQACTGKDELFLREVLKISRGECKEENNETPLIAKSPVFDIDLDLSSCIDSSFGKIETDPLTFGLNCSFEKKGFPDEELFEKIGCWLKGLASSKFPNPINSIPDGSNEHFSNWLLRSINNDEPDEITIPFKSVINLYVQILKMLKMPQPGSFDHALLQSLETISLNTLRQTLPSLTRYMYLRAKYLIDDNGFTPSMIEVKVPDSAQLIYNLFGEYYVNLLKSDDSAADFACNLLGCSDEYFERKPTKDTILNELLVWAQNQSDTFRQQIESKLCIRIMSFFDAKDSIAIDDIINLSPLEVNVLEESLTSMLKKIFEDGSLKLEMEVDADFPRTQIDLQQTLCKARLDDMIFLSEDNWLEKKLEILEPIVIEMFHSTSNCSFHPRTCKNQFNDLNCIQRLLTIEAYLRGNLMTLEPFRSSSLDIFRKIPYKERKTILHWLEMMLPGDFRREKLSNYLATSTRYRRDTGSGTQQAESDPLTLEFYIIVAFHLYHRSVSIARERIQDNQVTPEQNATLDQIISSQRAGIFRKLTSFFNSPGPVTLLSSEVKFAVIVLSDGLTKKETASVDSEVLAFYLKVTKQIINTLELNPDDFSIGSDFPVPNMISKYLFGMDSHLISRSNVYLSSVNEIYENLRPILAKMSQTGGLSALQIIRAKSIINELSANSVAFLVKTLQIEDTRMTPEEIMKTVVAKRENNEIDEDTEYFIKEKLYFLKLDALIKMISNLGMSRQDLPYPESTPGDLLDLLFNTNVRDMARVQQKHNPFSGNWRPPSNSDDQVHDYGEGFFCMQCFHRMYEAWKRGQGITDSSQNATSSLLRKRRGAVTTGDILDETLNDLVTNRALHIFPTNSTIAGDDVFTDSPKYAPYVTYLYIHVMEKVLLEMAKNGSTSNEIRVFVKNQHRRVTEELDKVLRQFPHTTIENPKGFLLEATSEEAHRVLIDFVVRFYLEVITKVVETMGWTSDDLIVFYSMPKRLKEIIFGNES